MPAGQPLVATDSIGKRTLVQAELGARVSWPPAVQREADNAVGIAPDWHDDPASFYQVWVRLGQIPGCAPVAPAEGPPSPAGPITAGHQAALRVAIDAFQRSHVDDIDTARDDARWMADNYDCIVNGRVVEGADDAAGPLAPGTFAPNDATHQALANAWPRDFFGATLASPAEAVDYLESQVLARGLPFDREKVNVVGVRGMQGGVAQPQRNAFLRTNTYDDTMFVVALDENGQPRLREFRGTTEPGGRTGFERRPDPRSMSLDPDQQSIYHLALDDTSKLGRPTITPRNHVDGGPGVIAPHLDRGRRSHRDGVPLSASADELPDGVATDDARLYGYQRTRVATGGLIDRARGIAMHSGGGGDRVNLDSAGCQVVHGDWYGGYVMAIRRALEWREVREARARGQAVTAGSTPDAVPASGYLLYSLLDAAQLVQGNAGVRGAIRDRRAARSPAPPPARPAPVQGDGGAVTRAGDVQARAREGVAGAGSPLPHLERIQAAFGRHDLAGVRAFIGGAAADAARSIGARAYATGDAIAFQTAPDLRQAAHEAAHVVQQRAGVQLDGGVGEAGDRYEQHADEVAARVVQGRSAESALDELTGGRGEDPPSPEVGIGRERPNET